MLSNGRSDYIRRVLLNVRDRQLKLLTTENFQNGGMESSSAGEIGS